MNMTDEEAGRIRAQLVAEGPTPCAELNLMLKYEATLRGVDAMIARLETTRARLEAIR